MKRKKNSQKPQALVKVIVHEFVFLHWGSGVTYTSLGLILSQQEKDSKSFKTVWVRELPVHRPVLKMVHQTPAAQQTHLSYTRTQRPIRFTLKASSGWTCKHPWCGFETKLLILTIPTTLQWKNGIYIMFYWSQLSRWKWLTAMPGHTQ